MTWNYVLLIVTVGIITQIKAFLLLCGLTGVLYLRNPLNYYEIVPPYKLYFREIYAQTLDPPNQEPKENDIHTITNGLAQTSGNFANAAVTIWEDLNYRTNQNAPISDTINHIMCACQRCFNVTCGFNSSGYFYIKLVSNKPINSSNDVSYFYVRLIGNEGVLTTLVSDLDRTLDQLDTLHVSTPGTYNVTINFIYSKKSSAYGLDRPQQKELNCTMCFVNSTCYRLVKAKINPDFTTKHPKRNFSWRLVSKEEKKLIDNTSISITDNGDTFYFDGGFVSRTNLFICSTCSHTIELTKCMEDKKFVIIGDSHEEMIAKVLEPSLTSNEWKMFPDGNGIYHNVSPDKNMKNYSEGIVPAKFVLGGMLRNLENGRYRGLQVNENFNGWVISTGHWDLRDVSLKVYIRNLKELFIKWDEFRSTANVSLFWNGIPSYSYKRDIWGGMELRTNVKIALADHFTKNLCQRFNVTFVPFFDISLPFYSHSCDTHHYLCPGVPSPVGSAQLNILLKSICNI